MSIWAANMSTDGYNRDSGAKMIVYITRHGQPSRSINQIDVPGDPPLSELGREQARLLGQRLVSIKFDGTIFSSPYRRTVETADIIADQLDTSFELDLALREQAGEGIVNFRGLTLEQVTAQYKRLAPSSQLPYPWWAGAENQQDVLARVKKFLDELIAISSSDALLVSHGASGLAAMWAILRQHDRQALRGIEQPWNCFFSAIRVKPQVQLLELCSVDHLQPDKVTSNNLTPDQIEPRSRT